MTGPERGFLLLTSHLGDPGRKVLTTAQFRRLTQRVRQQPKQDPQRDLTPEDLLALGYDDSNAQRICLLLSQNIQLDWYLSRAKKENVIPLTRATAAYPEKLWGALGEDCPGTLWARGDISLLQYPAVSLVGSRDLQPDNQVFAREVGRQAARQGYVLVSGNARGADRTAQESCLEKGGKVISVVADCLLDCPQRENVLYLSEDGFDLPFSNCRALSRNRIIHALGKLTFVAQCADGKGGTWNGTTQNLRYGWSPVFSFRDGSSAHTELVQMGATPVDMPALRNFSALKADLQSFL